MEVTGFTVERLEGALDEDPESFYEERLVRPTDRYDEFRDRPSNYRAEQAGNDRVELEQYWLRVETDAGIEGLAGPLDEAWARRAVAFEDLLTGRDPRATEKAFDLLYRDAVHGRKGEPMHAISAVDVALWDIKGKAAGDPVYRLLGGPTREELPAYASMLGYSVDPDRVRERAAEFADRGYGAQKWFFRHGPNSGHEGKRRNVAMAEAAREAVGAGYDLMFDCWMSWDRTYAEELLPRLADVDPRWLEEPVLPDMLDSYEAIREAAPFPVAGGEHEYTRYGVHELLSRGAVDVCQPDTYWAGGITELRHACTLGAVHDVPIVPHGHSVPANVHVVASQPPAVCPLVEYLVKWNETLQFFLAEPVRPEGGSIPLPERPGIGIELDDSAAETREVVEF